MRRLLGALDFVKSILHLIPVGQPLTTAIADTLGEVGKGLIKGESGWKIAENTGIAAKTTWEKNGGKIAEQFTVAPKNVLKDAEKDLAKQANWGNEVPKVKGEQLIKLRDAIKPRTPSSIRTRVLLKKNSGDAVSTWSLLRTPWKLKIKVG